jgi:hypothetical protein
MVTAAIVARELDGHQVSQRQTDGYVNATELCRAAGKLFADYGRLEATTAFLNEASVSMGIPIDSLVQSKPGRPDRGGGTWVHPDVAVHLAQWCSPRFAVAVSKWVRELLTTGRVELASSTGDVLLDSIHAIQRTTTALAEFRQRQIATEREVAEVRTIAEVADSKAEAADAKAEAALRRADGNLGYVSVLGYFARSGREVSTGQASKHGKALTALCRSLGMEVRQIADERHGFVNSYPESVLREYFDKVWTADAD